MIRLAIAAAVLALAAPVGAQRGDPAEAPDPTLVEAQDRILRGEELFERGDLDGALAEFRRAEELLAEHPMGFLVDYNIGRTFEELHLYDEAVAAYRHYLERGGDAVDDADAVRARLEVLEGLLGRLTVRSTPGGAEVWVDDRRLGTTPGTFRLAPGRHAVELRLEGHLSAREQAELTSRQTLRLDVELEPVPNEYAGLWPGWFWASASLTVVTGLLGAVFGVYALAERNRIRGQCAREPDGAACRSADAKDRPRIRAFADAATVLWFPAGVFAVATVVLALLTDFGGAEPAVAAWVGPTEGGVVLRGRF